MLKLLLILLFLSASINACGIINGDDEDLPAESQMHILLNGDKWEPKKGEPIRDISPRSRITLGPNMEPARFITGWRIWYEDLKRESLLITYIFPPDFDVKSLETPYQIEFLESNTTFSFQETDIDVPTSSFDRYDSTDAPRATITHFDLEEGTMEVEFEGTLIARKHHIEMPEFRPQVGRWYNVDTLRITEGWIRSVELEDIREEQMEQLN